MANERVGMEGASVDWSYAASQSYLPPRSPIFSGGGQSNNQENSCFFSNWATHSQAGVHRRNHQRTTSTSFIPQTPAWVDDLLNDTPDVPPARSNHRRSSSDSLAFLDAPLQQMRIQKICEEEELDTMSMDPGLLRGSRTLSKVDEEPNLSNCAEDGHFGKHPNENGQSKQGINQLEKRFPVETSSARSDQDSANASSVDDKRTWNMGQSRNDNEVQSALKSEHLSLQAAKGEAVNLTDGTLDPKRAKRILANRQSAQRSRVRKLQYIAELERTVNVLQEEVSVLSPQVTYLDRHRILLNVDNSAMKQRIAALAQEKLFKDAHNEALKSELHRLRQLYQQQQHKQTPQTPPNIGCQQYEMTMSSQLDMKENSCLSDVSAHCMEEIRKNNEANVVKGPGQLRSPLMKPTGYRQCSNADDKGKDAPVPNMPGLAQIHTDF
ncbi:hypothetical protein KP509_23G071200 [Ceratopteris richardii]|uniref:BZIP domain-containing protein n=1 Tax=Ceratopteris richardii TaxID=49495 RepID=A0A8T2S442_CERRI|nr:hypothetical protein KP509_23G071200 [Ceratopteris richardii]KAH7302414.1 hypothetical protein KP509_23G071200 [Ceratopteris richardii]